VLATSDAEWITAAGTCAAAVATFCAVLVALWQTRRKQKVDISVTFSWVAKVVHGEWVRTVELKAMNDGDPPVLIQDALIEFHRPSMHARIRAENGEFPLTLFSHDTFIAVWNYDKVEQIRKESHGEPYTHASFIDALGRTYSAPYPGVKLSRKNWRLKKRYVRETGGLPPPIE
jgi:hypothetical protein